MKKFIISIILLMGQLISNAALSEALLPDNRSESSPDVMKVFREYRNSKNVTMVELSAEMLDTYGMTHYKSITIKNDEKALSFVRKCLKADQIGARTIKEITDNGGVVSAYYQLKRHSTELNRFVLFKVNKKGVITLVYIEGELESDDLITLLFSSRELQQ